MQGTENLMNPDFNVSTHSQKYSLSSLYILNMLGH